MLYPSDVYSGACQHEDKEIQNPQNAHSHQLLEPHRFYEYEDVLDGKLHYEVRHEDT